MRSDGITHILGYEARIEQNVSIYVVQHRRRRLFAVLTKQVLMITRLSKGEP